MLSGAADSEVAADANAAAPHSHLTPASSNASDLAPPDPPPNASPVASDLGPPVVIKTAAAVSTPSPSVSLVRPEELSDSDEVPVCPICMEFYCEPLRTTCNHTFCRLCLLMTTRLSANGRACPMCRRPISMRDPAVEPEDPTLSEAVHRLVPTADYEARVEQMKTKIAELRETARMNLPIFFMPPCPRVGEVIGLHLFEPRYKLLIRRAMEGNAQFVYAGSFPQAGIRATIIQVDQAAFLADGRALIQGRGVQSITLSDVWMEDGTGGLYYTRLDTWINNDP